MIAAVVLLCLPLRAGDALMSRSGFAYWLQQKMLPRDRKLDALERRVETLENRLTAWENANLYRIYLWPGQPRAERYSPGGVPAGADDLDVPPRIIDGRTMVPLRFIGEALGAEVIWNGDARQVAYILGNRQILMTVDQQTALVGGRAVELDAAPQIVDGRTMVPVRFVSQWLGALVRWEEALKRVEIQYRRNDGDG
jgi:hypothetical protein